MISVFCWLVYLFFQKTDSLFSMIQPYTEKLSKHLKPWIRNKNTKRKLYYSQSETGIWAIID